MYKERMQQYIYGDDRWVDKISNYWYNLFQDQDQAFRQTMLFLLFKNFSSLRHKTRRPENHY